MLSFLGRMLRLLSFPFKVAWRRPKLFLLLTGVLLACSCVGLRQYALHQWQAARVALNAERVGEARGRLAFCLSVWPWDPEVHLVAARAARLDGDTEAAEAHLNRCLRLQNGATEGVQLEFLLLRVQKGEIDEVAAALIDTVEKGHPESPIILDTLAKAYLLRLRYKPAYACLSRWIELYPEAARAYQWRGWVLERVNKHKAAAEDYHRALELDPDLLPARLRVAEMLLEDNQAPEALPHLERLYRQAPDNPMVQARLGICRFIEGQTEEARRLMTAAVVQLPDDPSLLVTIARLHLQEGQGAEAERWLRKVLAKDPSDTEALYVLVSALRLQGRAEESAAVSEQHERTRLLVDKTNELLSKVADGPGATADEYAEIGTTLMQIGRSSLGVYWLEQALERDPGHQAAHRTLAEHFETKGEPERAAAHRRRLAATGSQGATPSSSGPRREP
jgi:tetratricopeptide (TPR) repeat protein